MSSRWLEKRIEAYRDGSLSPAQAEELRGRLEADPDARALLARHEALGRLTREAWTEGPPAPPAEQLIAALRVGMARIDAELAEAPPSWWQRLTLPVPLPALGMAFAALLVVVLMREGPPVPEAPAPAARVAKTQPAPAPSSPAVPVQPAATHSEAPDDIPVYDLAQGDSPLMLFEDQGTTFIWLMDPERAREDLSSIPTLSVAGYEHV